MLEVVVTGLSKHGDKGTTAKFNGRSVYVDTTTIGWTGKVYVTGISKDGFIIFASTSAESVKKSAKRFNFNQEGPRERKYVPKDKDDRKKHDKPWITKAHLQDPVPLEKQTQTCCVCGAPSVVLVEKSTGAVVKSTDGRDQKEFELRNVHAGAHSHQSITTTTTSYVHVTKEVAKVKSTLTEAVELVATFKMNGKPLTGLDRVRWDTTIGEAPLSAYYSRVDQFEVKPLVNAGVPYVFVGSAQNGWDFGALFVLAFQPSPQGLVLPAVPLGHVKTTMGRWQGVYQDTVAPVSKRTLLVVVTGSSRRLPNGAKGEDRPVYDASNLAWRISLPSRGYELTIRSLDTFITEGMTQDSIRFKRCELAKTEFLEDLVRHSPQAVYGFTRSGANAWVYEQDRPERPTSIPAAPVVPANPVEEAKNPAPSRASIKLANSMRKVYLRQLQQKHQAAVSDAKRLLVKQDAERLLAARRPTEAMCPQALAAMARQAGWSITSLP